MPVMEDTIDVYIFGTDSIIPGPFCKFVKPEAVKEEWVVYITGSVKKPGVYKDTDRIQDLQCPRCSRRFRC